ncbi:potassium voltage-gated channel subfamily G member 1-like [Stylophora pistillata]|uniref:potassium voltage-gated channel subfamily G member 1-like n=1 Tax=Stylophora pistillata TaxID=50429 RepID=UPI000C0412E5|nr:potassium voltage-gated channel subfamily G member 1-like [Stylophora pistillata]
MKTFASLLATTGFLLAHWIDIRGDESMCKKFCCEDNSNISLKNCCDEAISHLLPPRFYNFECVNHLLDLCGNDSTIDAAKAEIADAAKQNMKIKCSINCSENVFNTSSSTNISVNWTEPIIWSEDEDGALKHGWTEKRGNFILRMISHFCVNKTKAPLQCPITYRYPVFTGKEYFEKERFVCGLNAPAAYLVMKEAKYDILTVVYHSAKDLWATICICVTWMLISGVIIWLFERRNNSDEFPQSFWKGVREGTWWAVVTMTTVGYGDKSPKSSSARIYAAFWMVIGVILLSIFTAEVSSMLTATHTKPHLSVLNQSIGVPVGSKQYFQKEFGGAKVIGNLNGLSLGSRGKAKNEQDNGDALFVSLNFEVYYTDLLENFLSMA